MDIKEAINRLEALARRPHPRLLCCSEESSFWRTQRVERIFDCRHVLSAVRLEDGVSSLGDQLRGAGEEFVMFYSLYREVELFRQVLPNSDNREAGALIRMASPGEWPALDDQLRKWLATAGEEDELDFDPFFAHALAFAQIPDSADLFFIAAGGSEAGQIYQFSHDDLTAIPRAKSLADFLGLLVDRTSEYLEIFSADCCYIDAAGKMWIPLEVAS